MAAHKSERAKGDRGIDDSDDNNKDDRGIEWSLRAFASMRAQRLFLRARAVIKFVL